MSVYRTFYLASYLQTVNEIDHTRSHKANVVLICCSFTVTTILQEALTDLCKTSQGTDRHTKIILARKLEERYHYRLQVLFDAFLNPPA